MKNGSLELRKEAKGSFGGSIKAKRTVNYKKEIIKEKKVVGWKAAKKTVKRNSKGAANYKLVKKLHKSKSL